MSTEKRLRLAIPNGELKQDVIQFMQKIGLQFDAPNRKYLLPVKNIPIDFLVARASDVPRIVHDSRSLVKAGITGNDLIWEAGLDPENGEKLPIDILVPNAKKWFLGVGINSGFVTKIKEEQRREATVADLAQTMVATEYPRVASQYFKERDVCGVEIYQVGGTNEAMQFVFPNCFSSLGVFCTGETANANGIWILDNFYEGAIQMIEAKEKLNRRDREIIDDLREKIAVAIK